MSWLGRLLNGRELESQLSAELRDHVDGWWRITCAPE